LLESQVLDTPNRQLRLNISEIRKSAILLRRYIAPQKDVISELRFSEAGWLSSKNLRRLQEAQDTLLRTMEELDSIRERAQVVKDELVNSLSDKLNRNLYVLSVITAIFLPLGFLTGLFGINIGGMPGVDSDIAFTIFSISLVTVAIIQVILFKFFKWF
jgi:zinc transporter